MERIKNIRKPPNRGHRQIDRNCRGPLATAMDDLEERARLLWLQRQPRAGDLYDELDHRKLNLNEEK